MTRVARRLGTLHVTSMERRAGELARNEERMTNREIAAGPRALMLAATLVVSFGCASRAARATPEIGSVVTTRPAAGSTDSTPAAETPIVQVRSFPHSATVTVVAWSPDEADFGLRASLTRDGTLIRDHQLYVSTDYENVSLSPYISAVYSRAGARRNFVETTAPGERVLLADAVFRDIDACSGWPKCSPLMVRTVRVPDDLLRANRDSLAVRFYGRAGSELIIAIHRDLIDSYLQNFDSVRAALRKN